MKRILSILSIAAVLAACSNGTTTNTDSSALTPAVKQAPAYTPDTTGLAQFQEWKAQQQAVTETKQTSQPVHYVAAAPVKKVKKVYTNPVPGKQETAATSTAGATEAKSFPERNSTSRDDADSAHNAVISSESSNTAQAPVKKGWSKAAKGAAIGAGSGAVVGAVVNKKNRAVGGVIGGIIGAGGGYVIGRGMDKKDGRY